MRWLAALLLAGCADHIAQAPKMVSPPPQRVIACHLAGPITVSPNDLLTPQTRALLVRVADSWQRVCG